jgi:PAS domain S-box-containing protein
MGAVDYVSVPIVPEVLRAKVSVFLDLYRKTHELERLNGRLEIRVAERTAELAASARKLRQSEQLRHLALAAGNMGAWEWDAETRTVVWDEGHANIFGVEERSNAGASGILGRLIHPDDLLRVLQTLEQVTADAATLRIEFRVVRPDGETRWCLGAVAASYNEKGDILRVGGVTVDITERKRSEERQALLAAEVDHRARNVVTVVQSVLRITRADSIPEYIAAVDGRIGALSTAHKLLANARWEGADLRRLVTEEFAPYQSGEPGRITIEGPNVLLAPAMAQTIALALHELVTNAAKHGALSAEGGRIALSWRHLPDRLEFSWAESDGPHVEPPKRRGYGTRIFKAGIEQQLKGRVEFLWEPEGLRCNLSIPLHDEIEPADETRAQTVPGSPADSKPILLVEDEPTVSMMLADMIAEFGYPVDGPYNKYADAMRAAMAHDLSAAVLDVNVGGHKIYPLAELLLRRGVPFVFVTGYSADSIDRRFAETTVLQKPIDPQMLRAVLLEPRSTSLARPATAGRNTPVPGGT